MQHQFAFCPNQPVRPQRPERLFFGLFPDARAALGARTFGERFVREHRLTGTLLAAERLHVSLHHVGDYRRLRTRYVYAARQAAAAVAMPPFDVTFNLIGSFGGAPPREGRPQRRPLVLLARDDGLFALHRRLGRAMQRNGLNAPEGFVPHMTLFYGAAPAPLREIAPIRFVASEFLLVHSELGRTRYNVIDRWPLES